MTATNVGINGLNNAGGVKTGGSGNVQTADGAEFRDFLLEANTAVEDLVTGNETDITKVMSAVEKADVAFQTLMAVRGKLVDSYKEIMQIRL